VNVFNAGIKVLGYPGSWIFNTEEYDKLKRYLKMKSERSSK